MTEHSYTLLFEPAEEGGYVVFAWRFLVWLPRGDTYEGARERVKEAIEGYIESLQKDGQPIPADKKLTLEPKKEEIRIAVPEPA